MDESGREFLEGGADVQSVTGVQTFAFSLSLSLNLSLNLSFPML